MAMLVYQRVGVKLFSDSTVVRLMCGKHILILYCANPVLTAATSHPSGQPSWGTSEARCLICHWFMHILKIIPQHICRKSMENPWSCWVVYSGRILGEMYSQREWLQPQTCVTVHVKVDEARSGRHRQRLRNLQSLALRSSLVPQDVVPHLGQPNDRLSGFFRSRVLSRTHQIPSLVFECLGVSTGKDMLRHVKTIFLRRIMKSKDWLSGTTLLIDVLSKGGYFLLTLAVRRGHEKNSRHLGTNILSLTGTSLNQWRYITYLA